MKVHATGAREGKTFNWRANSTTEVIFKFVDGACDLGNYPANELPNVIQYLRVNLQVKTDLEVGGGKEGEPETVAIQGATDPIRATILGLDPNDDDNWATDGKAAVAVVAKLLPGVGRKVLDAVAPDLTREIVRRFGKTDKSVTPKVDDDDQDTVQGNES